MSNSFNEKLDEIFNDDYFDVRVAKQAIRSLILEEVIREDENKLGDYEELDKWVNAAQNELKAEQRSIVQGDK